MMNWWIVLWDGWPTKGVEPYFMPGPLSKILTIANLRHAASRVWTCAEPEFRLRWMKLCSSDKILLQIKRINGFHLPELPLIRVNKHVLRISHCPLIAGVSLTRSKLTVKQKFRALLDISVLFNEPLLLTILKISGEQNGAQLFHRFAERPNRRA